MKRIFVIFLTFLFVFSSISIAFADGGAILADVFIFRPMGFATFVGGSALFVVTLPLTAILSISNNRAIPETANTLVAEPFSYTFVRPLGENPSHSSRLSE